jgi:hypothetical protein
MAIAPHLTVAELELRYRQAGDPVARSQWQMLWLLAGGMPTAEVARVTGYSVRWVQEVARRYRAGPEAIGDRRHGNPGAAPLLKCAAAAVARRLGGTGSGWRSLDLSPRRGLDRSRHRAAG